MPQGTPFTPPSSFPPSWLDGSSEMVIAKSEWNRIPPGSTINEADYEIDWNAWVGLPYLTPGSSHPNRPLFHVFLKESFGFDKCVIPVAYFRGEEIPLLFTVAGPVDKNNAKPFYSVQYPEELKLSAFQLLYWGAYSSVSECFREFQPAENILPHPDGLKRLEKAYRELNIPFLAHSHLQSTYILSRLADDVPLCASSPSLRLTIPIPAADSNPLTGFPPSWLEPSCDVYLPMSQWNYTPGDNNSREWAYRVDWDTWTGHAYLIPYSRNPKRSYIHIFLKEYFGLDVCIIPVAFFRDDIRRIKLVFTAAGPIDANDSKRFYCVVYPDYFNHPEGLDDGPWLWSLGTFSSVSDCYKANDFQAILPRSDGRQRLEMAYEEYNMPSPFPS
ncbi:hypothetical protein C8R44DRAFT_848592 [Mycena epipterygia]|nr:hypothetical protein C8R44DRAFT_848592 [Mycena epipterygia]